MLMVVFWGGSFIVCVLAGILSHVVIRKICDEATYLPLSILCSNPSVFVEQTKRPGHALGFQYSTI
jgi:hypothetical protein